MKQKQIIVKRYESQKDYQKDAQRITAQGYTISSVASEQPRSGCLRIILTGGIGALVFHPKPILVVTYVPQ